MSTQPTAPTATAAPAGAFVATTRFKEAVAMINHLDTVKLIKVAATILARMAEKKSGSAFTEAEMEQLQEVLGISSSDVETLVAGSSYIFDQAAFNNLSPENLEPQLVSHGMEDTAAAAFKKVWGDGRAPFVSALRERTLGAPQTLDGVDWRLQLTMSSKDLSKTKTLSSVLDLKLGDASRPDAAPEHLVMELNMEQLMKLYNDLEKVQSQLDKITK